MDKMESVFLTQLLLSILLLLCSCGAEEDTEALSCPEYQQGFDSSCYEFVVLRRSFFSAQGWCERGGGHLAFIQNEETQQFLQKHLESETDWWLGLAPASANLTLDSAADGPLSWLDGSDVSYSNFVSSPSPGAGCAHVLRNSGFQWEATANCSQEFTFVCEFESGRTIACAHHNATLHCGSGQVIEVDDSFYGRKTAHYCRSSPNPSLTSTQEECSWMDVVDSVTGDCDGLQVCQATVDVASFGDPCPGLGSYLSVEYHCKEGLTLLMSKLAAVFEDVTFTVKWLLHPFQGNLSCSLKAGDGHTVDPYTPKELESSVVHKYSHPGVYLVLVECSTSEWHVTVQKTITIQEPVGEFGVIKCYSQNHSTDGANCKAHYGSLLLIQVEVETGTNVTYSIQRGDLLVSNSSVVRGIISHNITVGPEVQEQLGSGCHQLSLKAYNGVTTPAVSTELQVCLLQPVEGLQASLLLEEGQCPDSDLSISVSLERGAPVQLLFSVTGDNKTFSETRHMHNISLQVYNITPTVKGSLQITVKAWNVFSDMEVEVNLLNVTGACNNLLDFLSDHENTTGHVKKPRAYSLRITSTPDILVDYSDSVTMAVTGLFGLASGRWNKFEWSCKINCKCNDTTNMNKESSFVIDKTCLPDVFTFSEYTFQVKQKSFFNNWSILTSASRCISVTPKEFVNISISCSECDTSRDVKLKLDCVGSCPKVVWNIEDPEPLTGDLKECYTSTGRKPLIEKKVGGNDYRVAEKYLLMAKSKFQDLIVIAYGETTPGFAKYIIQIAGVTTPAPASTTKPARTQSTTSPTPPSCTISPQNGTVLDPFDINCTASSFCSSGNCLFCFTTNKGTHLRCSSANEVKSLYLPLGDESNHYSLSVVATVKNGFTKTSTSIATQVRPANSSSTVQELQSAVVDSVAQLQEQGLLSGENLGQMFQSVSDMLNNGGGSAQQTDARKKLREQMLTSMNEVLQNSPSNSTQEVQVTAGAVVGLTKKPEELTPAAQEKASSLVADLSSSLLSMNISQETGGDQVVNAATPIVEAASNILKVSSNKKISNFILDGMDNVQSALLNGKMTDQGPAIVSVEKISLFVNRVSPETLQMQSILVPKKTSPSFSFPPLPADVLSLEEPVDVRMMSFERNPFSWSKEADISGAVGSVSLSRENGSVIPIENLTHEIEILLPRLDVEQVDITILNLSNYSTLKINVPSPDVTLVLRMEPSEDLTFKLFLGDKNYPTTADNVAKTQMPNNGTKQEERYVWVLAPGDRGRHVGEHYLVVQPIVEAGVKSVNASVSVTSIAAQCKYWNESESAWSEAGCRVGPLTTPFVTQCLCNHLTFFGSSFFVMPNVVDVSRTAELFSTFTENPVVVCFVGAIFLAYLLVVVWARRKDINDAVKVKVTVLKDNDPLAEYGYILNISTGHRRGASTSAQVTITLLGTDGESEPHHLTDPDKPVFERGAVDTFLLTTPFSLGELQSIRMWHDNSGEHPSWYVNKVMIQDLQTGQKWHFLCNSWLAIDMGDCLLDRSFPVATELDLKRFSNLFFMKTAKDFCDGHIWFSVISRPPNSTFTCVQRVSCCFSLLLCTMLTNIMFYGIPTDPSEQTMDLGHIEFTWQQVMIGVQSSIIMFPINLLIVSIFRNTRPREKKPGQPKTEASKQGKTGRVSPSQPPSPQTERKDITPDTVIKDIKRIARSLSKAMKSPIPRLELELGSGRQADINILLSLVEDIIKQQNRAGGEFYFFCL